MHTLIRAFVALFALLFLLSGLGWIFAPSVAASFLGMSMMEGLGLSSLIGDVGAFFWGVGAMMVLGLKTRKTIWYQASAIFVGFAAVLRALAWAVHGAPFALEQIIIEVLIVTTLLFAASRLPEKA